MDDPSLFPGLAPARKVEAPDTAPPAGRQAHRPRLVPETDCWTVEDHVCKLCLGRIVSRVAAPERRFMCTDCGFSAEGASRTDGRLHPTFCACSMRYGNRDAGVRCTVNDAQTPELPQAVIARQAK